MTGRKLFAKQDIWLFAGLLVPAVILLAVFTFWGAAQGAARGIISVGGEVVREVELSENRQFTLEQNANIRFAVRDNAIAFIESDCPDRACIHSGYLGLPGQMTACLPNRVSLRIAGAGGPDAVAR